MKRKGDITMNEKFIMHIETGKDLKDKGIARFQMMDGKWTGLVQDNMITCRDASGRISFRYPCEDSTKINVDVIPLEMYHKRDIQSTEHSFADLRKLYQDLNEKYLWIIVPQKTGKVIGYEKTEIPFSTLGYMSRSGKAPVYEERYIVKKLDLTDKDDLYTVMTSDIDVYIREEDARRAAEKKNEWYTMFINPKEDTVSVDLDEMER